MKLTRVGVILRYNLIGEIMKYILSVLIFFLSCSILSASQWDKKGCARIELGVGQLIFVSENMRQSSEDASKNGDLDQEKELREQQNYLLESASHWATIYSTFCKK